MAAQVARKDFERAKAVFKREGFQKKPKSSRSNRRPSHVARLQSQSHFKRVSQLFRKIDTGIVNSSDLIDAVEADEVSKIANALSQLEFSSAEEELRKKAQEIIAKDSNADFKEKFEAEKRKRVEKEKAKNELVEKVVRLEEEELELKKEYNAMVAEGKKLKRALLAVETKERCQLRLEEWNFLLLRFNELSTHLDTLSKTQEHVVEKGKAFREALEAAISRNRGDPSVLLRCARVVGHTAKASKSDSSSSSTKAKANSSEPPAQAKAVSEKRNAAICEKVVQIANSIHVPEEFELVKKGRKFVSENTFRVITRSGKMAKRHVFLFNDLLIVCSLHSYGDRKYRFESSIPLDSAFLWDLENRENFKFSFEVMRTDVKFALAFAARSEEEKKDWLGLINAQITNPTL